MRKRLALLFYRVARWLAPDYFNNGLQSLNEIRERIGVLRLRLCSLSRRKLNGYEGTHILTELRSLEAVYKDIQAYGKQDRYELLKIEVPLTDGRKEDQKRKLFEALAAGLAQSAEIEKFMYLREWGGTKTIGVRVYLKHEDQTRVVGNYANKLDDK